MRAGVAHAGRRVCGAAGWEEAALGSRTSSHLVKMLCCWQSLRLPHHPLQPPTNPPPCPAHKHTWPQVLLVVEQPERQAEEAAADYAKRLQNDRVLALNPNFTAE